VLAADYTEVRAPQKFVLSLGYSKPHFLSTPFNPSEARDPVQGTRPESAQSITEGATKKVADFSVS